MSLKQTTISDVSKPRMWIMRRANDQGLVQSTGEDELKCCDCTRSQCQFIFDEYVNKNSSIRHLHEELTELKKDKQDLTRQISDMEQQYTNQLRDKEDEIASLLERVQSLSKSLEYERQLRMEDVFKLELQKKDTSRTEIELAEIRKQWIDALATLPSLQSENKLLKRQVGAHMDTIEKMNIELRTRNYDFAMLEDRNTHLRVRLSETETKLAQVLRSSTVNARISSSMSTAARRLPTLKSAPRFLGTGSNTSGSTELVTKSFINSHDSSISDRLLAAARPAGATQNLNILRYSYS